MITDDLLKGAQEDAGDVLGRIAIFSDGVLACPEVNGVRIYTTPPSLSTIRYLMNRVLGMPGVKIREVRDDSNKRLNDVLHYLLHVLNENAKSKDKVSPISIVKERLQRMEVSANKVESQHREEDRFVELLPTAIMRLGELCAGVIVRKPLKAKRGSDPGDAGYADVQLKPDSVALRYLIKRLTDGENEAAGTKLPPARIPGKKPIVESYDGTLPEWTIPLFEKQELKAHAKRFCVTHLFDPVTKEQIRKTRLQLPSYYEDAWMQMSTIAPIAVKGLVSLANGAITRTVFSNGDDEIIVQHAPSIPANIQLATLIYGKPKSELTSPYISCITLLDTGEKQNGYIAGIIRACRGYTSEARELIAELIRSTTTAYKPICSSF